MGLRCGHLHSFYTLYVPRRYVYNADAGKLKIENSGAWASGDVVFIVERTTLTAIAV